MEKTADICAIHQPNFFPRMSTLAKLYAADILVILDDVQFVRRDYQHRCRLADASGGSTQWLPLSVHLPDGRASRINDATLVDAETCARRTFAMIQHYCGRTRYWPELRGAIEELAMLIASSRSLSNVATATTTVLLGVLGWKGEVLRSSALTVRDGRSERLADLTAAVGAATYLCGEGGSRYLDVRPFDQLGLRVDHFKTPSVSDGGMWIDARRLSALWALMKFGSEQVREGLDEAAERYR